MRHLHTLHKKQWNNLLHIWKCVEMYLHKYNDKRIILNKRGENTEYIHI